MPKTVVQQGMRGIETRDAAFPPANPELSEQLFSRVGYVGDFGGAENEAGSHFQQPLRENRV